MKYKSKYSNNKLVSEAQYITELICENKAKIEKKDLHFKFWVNKEWSAFYRNQIASANKLLKLYNSIDIIRALKTSKGQRIYSLRAPHLIDLIQIEKNKSEKMQKLDIKPIDRKDDIKIKSRANKKNILDKLEDIE